MFLRLFFASAGPRGRPSTTKVGTILRRNYAVQTPGRPTLEVFNRKVKHLQKDRAARNVEESRKVDYLKNEIARRLCERLLVRFLLRPAETSQCLTDWFD